MKKIFNAVFIMIAVCCTLLGCNKNSSGPTTEQLIRDLNGQEFFWRYTWGGGGNKYTVQDGNVKELVIQKRLTDSTAGTEEIHALTTLSFGKDTIRGVLAFQYKKFDQGWSLRSVGARDEGPGKSFSFEVLNPPVTSQTLPSTSENAKVEQINPGNQESVNFENNW